MTIEEKINTIACPEIRARAIRAAKINGSLQTESRDSIASTIDQMCSWSSTIEGSSFWSYLDNHVKKEEFTTDPNLFDKCVHTVKEDQRVRISETCINNSYSIY